MVNGQDLLREKKTEDVESYDCYVIAHKKYFDLKKKMSFSTPDLVSIFEYVTVQKCLQEDDTAIWRRLHKRRNSLATFTVSFLFK